MTRRPGQLLIGRDGTVPASPVVGAHREAYGTVTDTQPGR